MMDEDGDDPPLLVDVNDNQVAGEEVVVKVPITIVTGKFSHIKCSFPAN